MATFTGKSVELHAAPETVYARLSNFTAISSQLDQIPEEYRAKMGDVKFTDDSIVINAAPAGEITLTITERVEPSKIVLSAQNSPVPLAMIINIAPGRDETSSKVYAEADVEIPAMLKPFVGPKLQESADKFGEMLGNIFRG
ncbi:MAG: hypothetical protein NC342_09225 [Pseudoflavonifractor sp.]|nr:hypothetical protein [Alloprevotella sp.]MCM1117700.1 hypothetical protein [Pseudoflavonifractor sp.]